jgi:acylphosphatase
MTEHRTFRIHGHVQGVFFRQNTREQARQLGLTGYARNNSDATVTIEAEGAPAALDQLEQWCHNGPAAARVDRVESTVGPLVGYASFDIRH